MLFSKTIKGVKYSVAARRSAKNNLLFIKRFPVEDASAKPARGLVSPFRLAKCDAIKRLNARR